MQDVLKKTIAHSLEQNYCGMSRHAMDSVLTIRYCLGAIAQSSVMDNFSWTSSLATLQEI
jgi:hypothetical protein